MRSTVQHSIGMVLGAWANGQCVTTKRLRCLHGGDVGQIIAQKHGRSADKGRLLHELAQGQPFVEMRRLNLQHALAFDQLMRRSIFQNVTGERSDVCLGLRGLSPMQRQAQRFVFDTGQRPGLQSSLAVLCQPQPVRRR